MSKENERAALKLSLGTPVPPTQVWLPRGALAAGKVMVPDGRDPAAGGTAGPGGPLEALNRGRKQELEQLGALLPEAEAASWGARRHPPAGALGAGAVNPSVAAPPPPAHSVGKLQTRPPPPERGSLRHRKWVGGRGS